MPSLGIPLVSMVWKLASMFFHKKVYWSEQLLRISKILLTNGQERSSLNWLYLKKKKKKSSLQRSLDCFIGITASLRGSLGKKKEQKLDLTKIRIYI